MARVSTCFVASSCSQRYTCYRPLEDRSLNPVLICRYRCTGCQRTCSRLPECIAPRRRGYDWLQQAAWGRRLTGCPEGSCADCWGPDERTVDRWWLWLLKYYAYRALHLEGLTPKVRADRGQSKLSETTQAAILAAKRDNPRRSIRQIRPLLEAARIVAHGSRSRSTIHRLLQQHGLSRITGSASLPEEKQRSFVAASAGAIWYGDVMHGIPLIDCRPYAPEGKGKLECWHRTCRDQFLSELDERHLTSLADINARLGAWVERVYPHSPHDGLGWMTLRARYPQDLSKIRPLGLLAAKRDAWFYHRVSRRVRKDGTVSYQGKRFEVPFELSGKTVCLVVDPHTEVVVRVEDENGEAIGLATPLDALANLHRQRRKPEPVDTGRIERSGPNLVELVHQQYYDAKGD